MPISQAILDEVTQTYVEVPFSFDPMPVLPGPRLDSDIAIVLACHARAGVLPTAPALLFMGDAALGVFLRRCGTREAWAELTAEIERRHPAVVAHDAEVRARVAALATGDRAGTTAVWRPTMPEVCAGSALLTLLPPDVTVVADAPLPGGRGPRGHVRRCDYQISSGRGELRIEVAGVIPRCGPPPTFISAQYAQDRMPARDRAYAALGLLPPVTIFADEALDRSVLLPIVAGIIAQIV